MQNWIVDRRQIADLRAQRAVKRALRHKRAVGRATVRARHVAAVVALVTMLGVLVMALADVV
jgi:hypothetical protein